jgi:hypothetical protein
MRPTVKFKAIVIALSFFTLTLLVLLSVACDKNNPAQNQETNAAPSSKQSNAPAPTITPNTNSPANNNVGTNAPAPSIQITVVPSKGAGPDALETVAGTVSGVNVKECKVVIFARTNTWYVQPYIDSPDTMISDDGTWHNDTHLGSEYAALLVKGSYKPPSTTGRLPATGGLILAVATANAK